MPLGLLWIINSFLYRTAPVCACYLLYDLVQKSGQGRSSPSGPLPFLMFIMLCLILSHCPSEWRPCCFSRCDFVTLVLGKVPTSVVTPSLIANWLQEPFCSNVTYSRPSFHTCSNRLSRAFLNGFKEPFLSLHVIAIGPVHVS